MNTSAVRSAAVAIGPALAVLLAWLTGTADDGISVANVALLLAFVCVAAALLRPLAGVTTSIGAALALNYFHTVPVHSLRMSDPQEATSVLLLMALGLSVSVATTLRVRSRVTAHHTSTATAASDELVSTLRAGGPLPAVWMTAVQAACRGGAAIDVQLVANAPSNLPVVAVHSSRDGSDTLVVPETGAVLPLPNGSGDLLLRPQGGMGSVTVNRTALVQFAEQVGSALQRELRSVR
ncbi:MAG: hypothetical protein RL238_1372 [Actinomycetota bacterium]